MTRGEDVVLCLGGASADFAGTAERPRVELSKGELSRFLVGSDAASITVCAPWHELTAGVLRELAEWAADKQERGCGVVPEHCAPGAASGDTAGSRALLVSATDCTVLSPSGLESVTEGAAVDLLCSAAPPAALAITGHGGEHCIYMGARLLTTYRQVSLAGEMLPPENIRCRSVFLNTCGSLRLGDSVVPRGYSLAGRLYQQGIAVIGAYRNQFTGPEIALLFAREAIAGVPLGRVASHLNRESQRLGDPAHSYQLLGDATVTVSNAGTIDQFADGGTGRILPAKLVRELTWLDELFATVASWTEVSANAAEQHQAFVRNLRFILAASHRNARYQLGGEEMAALAGAARQLIREEREMLLTELTRYTLQGVWPQSLCAPVASRPVLSRIVCPRCEGRAMRYDFTPLEKRLLHLSSEDCDRCGTVSDRVGRAPTPVRVEAEYQAGEIHVQVPPLAANCSGRITVHRSGSVPPQIWPGEGGGVRIPVAEIPFRGKTTLAVSRIGPDFLAWNYVTIFVPPS